MSAIWADTIVSTRAFPEKAGEDLATHLCELEEPWPTQVILNLPASMLISTFFRSFLQRVHALRPDLVEVARLTRWEVKHDFQRENIARWMRDFTPTGV